MKRAVLLGAVVVAAVVAASLLWRDAPRQWSVLVVVAEPPGGALLPGAGSNAATPRLRKLAGAGVRLPLAAPERDAPQFVAAVLGSGAPTVGVLSTWEARGWSRVVASAVPFPGVLSDRFDSYSAGPSGDVVDRLLAGLESADVRPGDPTLAVAIAQPRDAQQWDQAVSRAVDGAASRMTMARTLVLVIDRAERSALLIAPERPDTLVVQGALTPDDLGQELNRWLRLN